MKLTRFAAIALSAVALAAGAPLAAQAATAQAATAQAATGRAVAAESPAATVAVYNCANQPQIRPRTYDLFCDGSGSFTGLTWSTWNASAATATGTLFVDNCDPNCAAGKWSHRTVDLILWRSKPVKGHPGARGYTQLTVLYPGAPLGHNTFTQAPPGAFPGEF